MKAFYLSLFAVLCLVLAGASTAVFASDALDGTWQLASRDMPGGGVMKSPDLVGMYSCHDGRRNFNVAWKTADGKMISISIVSSYELGTDTYTETPMYSAVNMGDGVQYEMAVAAKTSAVTRDGSKVTIDMPFEPVVMTVDGDAMTAQAKDGSFTDHWVRMK